MALSSHNVPVTIYESRPAGSDILASGVVLTPNGLHILDHLGVLPRIKDRCYTTTYRTFKNDQDETIRKVLVATTEQYGYSNHRVWRKVLLEEMKQMLSERCIQIQYDSKFNGIASDGMDGVTFRINAVSCKASLLIGSDGVHSSVRNYLAPDIEPEYTGTVGIMAHIKRASVNWPYDDYERNATIQGKPGAFFFIPEDPQAEDIMIGMQAKYPQQSRDDLDRLQVDKTKLLDFYRKDYDEWGPTAQSIIDGVSERKETLFIWPYMRMPKMPRWYSETGRVILIGDGAHQIPPSSGQGVNQALEDVYTLTLLLTSIAGGSTKANGHTLSDTKTTPQADRILDALRFWQRMRQKRVDTVTEWATNSTNVQRLPEAERKKLVAEGKIKEGKAGEGDDMSWLYQPQIEEEIRTWSAVERQVDV